WLVPHLQPIWSKHNQKRLVEPFCGGFAVSLGLLPKRALISDVNPHVINFYRWLQRGLKTNLSMENTEGMYYRYRGRFNQLVSSGKSGSREAAELFYYLNRTGYNGLCRFNGRGAFNVPFGRYSVINYMNDFGKYKRVLRNWELQCRDFETLAIEPDDFIYADPPYDVEFTKYSKEDFTWKDQVRLAEWLREHPGPVVLSNQATDRIVRLYSKLGFKLQYFHAPRMISCTGNRSKAREVLATRQLSVE